MAEDLIWERHPSLERPVLVAAFRGWNDGGHGASLAAGYLARVWGARRFAEIDAEAFFDFQATRPQVTLIDGVSRRIDWPETVFYHARPEGSDRDVILLLGVEPNYRWRTFSELVSGLATDLGVELVVTLGSLLADVPHTRPAPVTGSANDATLIEELGLSASRYEGPTGIVGVVHDACARAGLPSASLWAAVPHYVQLTPSPRAAKALVERLGTLLDFTIDVSELEEASAAYAQQVSEAVAVDPETQSYVEELEQRVDELDDVSDEGTPHNPFATGATRFPDGQLPSGDALAAELTRFLREREEDDGDDAGDADA
jgi:proteasome assembly chaperone (PAC2) family protein